MSRKYSLLSELSMFYRYFYKTEVSQESGLTKMAAVKFLGFKNWTIEAQFSLFFRSVISIIDGVRWCFSDPGSVTTRISGKEELVLRLNKFVFDFSLIDYAESQSQNHTFHQEKNGRLDLCSFCSGCPRALSHCSACTLQGKLLGERLKLTRKT